MKKYTMLKLHFNLFGDGGEGGSATAGSDSSAMGEADAKISGNTHRKTGAFDDVIFGKQDMDDAGPDGDAKRPQKSADEKRKAFTDMVNGEYKDQYTEATQRMIDKRFKEFKGLQNQLDSMKPIMDMMMSRHGITDGDYGKLKDAIEADQSYWAEAADEAGMTIEQYKQFQKLQRENAELRRVQQQKENDAKAQRDVEEWLKQSEEVKKSYPDFDLKAELQNPRFVSLLQSNIPVKDAYITMHMDDIVSGAIRTASMQAEKRVTDNIRARGNRPAENATQNRSAFQVRDDVSKLTKAERAEAVRRAARGETIKF